jgi:hypothetical protein
VPWKKGPDTAVFTLGREAGTFMGSGRGWGNRSKVGCRCVRVTVFGHHAANASPPLPTSCERLTGKHQLRGDYAQGVDEGAGHGVQVVGGERGAPPGHGSFPHTGNDGLERQGVAVHGRCNRHLGCSIAPCQQHGLAVVVQLEKEIYVEGEGVGAKCRACPVRVGIDGLMRYLHSRLPSGFHTLLSAAQPVSQPSTPQPVNSPPTGSCPCRAAAPACS